MGDLVQIGEAVGVLKVDRATIRRWERRGLVTPLRDYRGYRFYRREDLKRLAAMRRPKPVASGDRPRR